MLKQSALLTRRYVRPSRVSNQLLKPLAAFMASTKRQIAIHQAVIYFLIG